MKTSEQQPNILFIMSDDHAAHAISCYGSLINRTPNIDRIAAEGIRFDQCYCTNSICAPSRASILTGLYSHLNGVRTHGEYFDGRQQTFPKLLQEIGYQTAIVGKWHLGHGGVKDPTGFDYWNVLPGQGEYHDPNFMEMGVDIETKGYVSEIITDISLDWLRERDPDRPFMLMCHHKAPHRPWEPGPNQENLFADEEIPEPPTLFDDYANRSKAAGAAHLTIRKDLNETDLKGDPPEGLDKKEELRWKYQRYIKDYLRCVASIDDSVGRFLDFLDQEDLAENTIIIYTSDQGFFLGDHGWYDKRFMYEESLKMPLLVRYPREINAGSRAEQMALNIDFAPTFLDFAGADTPRKMQGASLRSFMKGEHPSKWRKSMYYRYWAHLISHEVPAHYGIRTEKYKLIHYYGESHGIKGTVHRSTPAEWELFDLDKDPMELNNVYSDPIYEATVRELKQELQSLKQQYGDDM
jgi:arylsulfatase A-like enzyme